jgi:RNA:NAD 2'-phosphotransferase (TPT1/KptA family)
MYANNRQYHDVEELKVTIREAWHRIPEETIRTLVNSMKKRIFQVIERRGGVTDY